MTAPILELVGLHKSYGSHAVLKGIDLRVRPGELVCVIGPSGSGKSSMLRCCNRLEEPSAGQVVVDGVDITRPGVDLNRVRQGIGMVFQQFNLYPHLSVLANVTLALRKVQKLKPDAARQRGLAALSQPLQPATKDHLDEQLVHDGLHAPRGRPAQAPCRRRHSRGRRLPCLRVGPGRCAV